MFCWADKVRHDDAHRRALLELGDRMEKALWPALELERARERADDDSERMRRLLEITGTVQVEQLISSVLQTALRVTGMEYGTVRQFVPATNTWQLLGAHPAEGAPGEIPHDPILAESMAHPNPRIVPDTAQDSCWQEQLAAMTHPARKKYLSDIAASAHVPMRYGNTCHALILLDSTKPVEVRPEVAAFLSAIAAHAALALQEKKEMKGALDLTAGIFHALGSQYPKHREQRRIGVGEPPGLNRTGDETCRVCSAAPV